MGQDTFESSPAKVACPFFCSIRCLQQKASMPVPSQYQRTTDLFNEFLVDARDTAGLGSTYQTYTITKGLTDQ